MQTNTKRLPIGWATTDEVTTDYAISRITLWRAAKEAGINSRRFPGHKQAFFEVEAIERLMCTPMVLLPEDRRRAI